mgnify:CR=1 FL=1
MKNIEDINKANLQKLISTKKLPDFFPGDFVTLLGSLTEDGVLTEAGTAVSVSRFSCTINP